MSEPIIVDPTEEHRRIARSLVGLRGIEWRDTCIITIEPLQAQRESDVVEELARIIAAAEERGAARERARR